MRLLLFPTAAVALSGCIVVSDVDVPGAGFDDDGGRFERLYAASVESNGVRIRVASNGCTDEGDFDVDVNRAGPPGSASYWVRFEREEPDNCRAFMAEGVELFFSYERLNLPEEGRVNIANPIGR